MMRRSLLLIAAIGSLHLLSAGAPSFAQQPTRTTASSPAAPKTSPARKRPSSYAQCLGTARQNGLRGAQRRRFVARCRFGYETPVFKP